MSDLQVLNTAALEQLEKDTSPEIVPVILGKFLEELQKRCADLRTALEAGDAERVGLEAHSVKSAARTFGLEQLSDLARQLEERVHEGQAPALAGPAEEMLAAAEAARAALEGFLAGGR